MIATFIFWLINKLLEIIGALAGILYGLLPNSPFTIIENSEFGSLIAKINYFLPIYEFVAIMETWLIAISVFYLYSLFARWIKAVQ